MFQFLLDGGVFIMFPLTILLFVNFFFIVKYGLINWSKHPEPSWNVVQIDYIKYIGIIALTFGLLGQIMGLYGAFEAIEKIGGEVAPGIFYAGLKVSSISTIYGMVIFLISYTSWFLIKLRIGK